MRHWTTIPHPKQRALVRNYVETDYSMAACASNAGYSGANMKQIANTTIRRLRDAGYDIPFRSEHGGVDRKAGPMSLIDELRSTMLLCADKLEEPISNREIPLVVQRLREAAARS